MDNLNSNYSNFEIRSQNAVAMPPRMVTYGTAHSLRRMSLVMPEISAPSLAEQVNFFFSEYFKGLFFVILTSLVIFLMPMAVIRHGSIRRALMGIGKRTMDIVGSAVGLILTLPFWLVIPIVIKLDSPGPIFYTQTRIGLNRRRQRRRAYQKADAQDRRRRERRRSDMMGKPFKVLKFRTMMNDAEKKSGPVWASKGDPRITRVGRFLRKTRIDEIPQFINVLVGDMSLVGPRPERPNFVLDLSTKIDGYTNRLGVKPGLTGLAQVENGYDSSLASVVRKVRYDLEYIEKRSVWTDIKIMLKTVVVVITGKGAC